MSQHFIPIDRDSPMLLPVDLRDWLPESHLVHFVIEAVEGLPLTGFKVNHRGTGDAQYPPGMMLSLLIYCYATGRFSSREIEAASHFDVAVRYICGGNTHPDHDTICTFRRENGKAFELAFVHVLGMARELGVLKKTGGVSVDGTKVNANASKHAAVSYKRAGEMIAELEKEVQLLMVEAERADKQGNRSTVDLPAEIARRKQRREQLAHARKIIEGRFAERREEKQAEYDEKQARRDAARAAGKKPRGVEPACPASTPEDKEQVNFTDEESRIMKVGNGGQFEQAYNAQAAVDIEGSMLVLGQRVTDRVNDKAQLEPTVAAIDPTIRQVTAVLADTGYYADSAIQKVTQSTSATCYVATGKQPHHRSVEAVLNPLAEPPPLLPGATPAEVMSHLLATPAGKAIYALRKQTVEPVFGIIKQAMGFRQFLLRGLENVSLEWTLVTLAYNVRRIFRLKPKHKNDEKQVLGKVPFGAVC